MTEEFFLRLDFDEARVCMSAAMTRQPSNLRWLYIHLRDDVQPRSLDSFVSGVFLNRRELERLLRAISDLQYESDRWIVHQRAIERRIGKLLSDDYAQEELL